MNCLIQRQSFSDNENVMIKYSEPTGEALVRGIVTGLCSVTRRSYCTEPTGEALVRGIVTGLCSVTRRS